MTQTSNCSKTTCLEICKIKQILHFLRTKQINYKTSAVILILPNRFLCQKDEYNIHSTTGRNTTNIEEICLLESASHCTCYTVNVDICNDWNYLYGMAKFSTFSW